MTSTILFFIVLFDIIVCKYRQIVNNVPKATILFTAILNITQLSAILTPANMVGLKRDLKQLQPK